jgi:hypothetical protein
MDNTREKLIELLESAESAIYWDSSDKGFIEKIADHLISHGMVVREKGGWVLTDARFAEMSCSLCGFTYYGEYDKECMSDFCPDCGADMRKGEDG